MLKSSISGRTRDEVSALAYRRLVQTYSGWADVANAAIAEVEAVIGDVTFPDVKARYLHDALRAIAARQPDFDLGFLHRLGVARALAWLERLPGVGRKVSASTLNFSTLHMPAFVVDTHILRILRRFGFVRGKADTRSAYEAVMATAQDWTATDLAELHILMKRLGQTVCCADRSNCRGCRIGPRCRTAASALSLSSRAARPRYNRSVCGPRHPAAGGR